VLLSWFYQEAATVEIDTIVVLVATMLAFLRGALSACTRKFGPNWLITLS
jgi:hypothetical protein